ncbi:unnamed protein product [Phytophthora fragariaefolia]|uniref:Unnamed protein product n=1 Tax=Phytophthora fragariaefolia TaxID=1490495 RepID=A0A9W6YE29_9STRA|nr:unnamed protein product [Phytophthora fragariaefolia]
MSVKKDVKDELLRWAMKIMNFRYSVEHVPGAAKVWADMIPRWAGNHAPVAAIKRIKAIRRRLRQTTAATSNMTPLRSLDSEDFV